ncbi:MAG: hypothetical protein FWE48_01330 [Coriobacteriia bacterium]|nr:hypothetical protein [Coriobacteriia bacterium]MCL2745722.1 hypothetical protein [Coriobacteriia bacterium]MCL2871078.1 hypothetical protein [Coriobacteriia bacterium]
MKVQKGSLFVLALALCMTAGLFSLQAAATPNFTAPFTANIAAAAEAEEREFAEGEEAEDIFPDEGLGEDIALDGDPIDIEPIAGDMPDFDADLDAPLDDTLTDTEEEAETAVDEAEDDPAGIGWIPVAITVAGLFVAGGVAFFVATRKKKA